MLDATSPDKPFCLTLKIAPSDAWQGSGSRLGLLTLCLITLGEDADDKAARGSALRTHCMRKKSARTARKAMRMQARRAC